MSKDILTLQDIADMCTDINGAAKTLGCSRQAVHLLIIGGKIPSLSFGNGNHHIVLKSDVESFSQGK